MSLHSKKHRRSNSSDALYASSDMSQTVPKNSFPGPELAPRAAYQLIHDELLLDGNARQNLATFCQTWEEPEVHQLMDECIDKNMIDKDEYPQTAVIESRCVHMLADLWNSPAALDTTGCSTTGSSRSASVSRETSGAAYLPASIPTMAE